MTSPSGVKFDLDWHVTPMDIAVDSIQHPSFIQVTLKGSKTDQARYLWAEPITISAQ